MLFSLFIYRTSQYNLQLRSAYEHIHVHRRPCYTTMAIPWNCLFCLKAGLCGIIHSIISKVCPSFQILTVAWPLRIANSVLPTLKVRITSSYTALRNRDYG